MYLLCLACFTFGIYAGVFIGHDLKTSNKKRKIALPSQVQSHVKIKKSIQQKPQPESLQASPYRKEAYPSKEVKTKSGKTPENKIFSVKVKSKGYSSEVDKALLSLYFKEKYYHIWMKDSLIFYYHVENGAGVERSDLIKLLDRIKAKLEYIQSEKHSLDPSTYYEHYDSKKIKKEGYAPVDHEGKLDQKILQELEKCFS